MESKSVNITKEELDDFMRQIEGIKSTIEILQDKNLMKQVKTSERLKKKKAKLIKLNV